MQEEDAAALKTALTEVEAGRMYEGLRQLKQLLRHNPNYPHTYFYLARIYGQMGQKETALRYLGKAIELEPQQGAYYNLVGAFLLQQEKFQGALEQFQKALARTPEKEKTKRGVTSALRTRSSRSGRKRSGRSRRLFSCNPRRLEAACP